MINDTIGSKLKRLRTNEDNRTDLKKMSRPEFCSDFNSRKYENAPELLTRTLKSWEDGQNRPNTNYLHAFCEYFQVDMSYWFDDQRIASEKVVEDISDYTHLNYESVIELANSATNMDTASLQTRDKLITTGTMELLARYASKIEMYCHELQVHSQIILSREQNSEINLSDKQYSMLFKLDLYRIRDYREKMIKTIDSFLDLYTDYTKITDNAEETIDLLDTLEVIDRLPEEQTQSETVKD